ncbi:solute carrier family 23 protein [Ancylobacter defluvii]|uniref:Permease n=1 Tax=Ancylobacter defluvii TaxID=1282440 RepID=A0A9W6JZF9_9HYPH|nr:solute carrier family 23 protein [Ancylobacter defluvii]MBS7589127.1 purine/pyrimidine permease [Ancylobacter defluvii]GLK84739.1 permease [Ancylobacter defluvii]
MPRKPSNIVYAADDKIPLGTLLILGVQHATLALLFVVYPLVAAVEAGLSFDDTQILITSCIIFMGVATILECLPRSKSGAGLLLVQIPNMAHLPLAVQSLAAGGTALYAAMSLVAAISQFSLTRFQSAMRALFPPEICGVAVTMLGVALAAPALRRMFGLSAHEVTTLLDLRFPLVSFTTLLIIIVLAIFSRGPLRLFAVAIGAAVGWALAASVGVARSPAEPGLGALAFIDLPRLGWPGLAFSWAILPAAILTGIISAVDMLGTVVSMQRMDDADWRRADMGQAARAIRANTLSDAGAAVTGGFASASSSAAIGVAFATGATAWRIGVVSGVMILLAAFSPKLIGALTVIPDPVIGAILVYSAAFLIVAGMDLILSRRLSDRRIFTVGLAVMAGLAVAILPELVRAAPNWAQPILESPLSVSTAIAVALNLFFRIGIRQEASVTVTAADNPFTVVTEFLEGQGDVWGARRDVIATAIPVVAEAVEMLLDTGVAPGTLEMRAHFDEMNFDIVLLYQGEPIEIPTLRPSPEDLLGDSAAVARFVGYMLSKRADKLVIGKTGDRQALTLRFEH